MGWGIVLEGRTDAGAVLLVMDDRQEAEDIAAEIRRRGQQVVVRRYPDGSQAKELPGNRGAATS